MYSRVIVMAIILLCFGTLHNCLLLLFILLHGLSPVLYSQVQHMGEECAFTPEQVMAMMLTYLKQVAQKALEKPVADCVVSVSKECE